MSEASDKLALTLATEHEALTRALREMAAYEQALKLNTTHYVYPFKAPDRMLAEKRGLIRVLSTPSGRRYRLTGYGREVVASLDLIMEGS